MDKGTQGSGACGGRHPNAVCHTIIIRLPPLFDRPSSPLTGLDAQVRHALLQAVHILGRSAVAHGVYVHSNLLVIPRFQSALWWRTSLMCDDGGMQRREGGRMVSAYVWASHGCKTWSFAIEIPLLHPQEADAGSISAWLRIVWCGDDQGNALERRRGRGVVCLRRGDDARLRQFKAFHNTTKRSRNIAAVVDCFVNLNTHAALYPNTTGLAFRVEPQHSQLANKQDQASTEATPLQKRTPHLTPAPSALAQQQAWPLEEE